MIIAALAAAVWFAGATYEWVIEEPDEAIAAALWIGALVALICACALVEARTRLTFGEAFGVFCMLGMLGLATWAQWNHFVHNGYIDMRSLGFALPFVAIIFTILAVLAYRVSKRELPHD